MNLKRLRTLASAEVRPVAPNLERLQLVADPELAETKREWEAQESNERYWRWTERNQGKGTNPERTWRRHACGQPLRRDGWCESCRQYAEAGYDHGR